ncbi:MAG TPA: hypothetical protein VLE51_02205 [Candidatus Saccharimonadales bacterium]|nr:hypothetical protein [Candidatus Saccharimonadales bacterium]
MTGNIPSQAQVLGASTVAGSAIAVLPNTSGNSVFRYFLLAILVVAASVLAMRAAKLVSSKLNK